MGSKIKKKITSVIDIPSRPFTDNLFDPVGLKPTTPQKDAGILTDPAVSEQMLKDVQQVATAAAQPPDEPPLINPLL